MNKIQKLKKFIESSRQRYESLGYTNYGDVIELVKKTKLGDTEVKRCDFLLEMLDEIENILGDDNYE